MLKSVSQDYTWPAIFFSSHNRTMRFHTYLVALATGIGLLLSSVNAQQQIAVNAASAPDNYGIEVEVINENIGFAVN